MKMQIRPEPSSRAPNSRKMSDFRTATEIKNKTLSLKISTFVADILSTPVVVSAGSSTEKYSSCWQWNSVMAARKAVIRQYCGIISNCLRFRSVVLSKRRRELSILSTTEMSTIDRWRSRTTLQRSIACVLLVIGWNSRRVRDTSYSVLMDVVVHGY